MTDIKTSKNKYYILGALFLIGALIRLIMSLAPNETSTTEIKPTQTAAVAETVTPQTTAQHKEIEPVTLKTSEKVTSELDESMVLYDTKSDMTIQPIDPDTDPANKIDKIEEQL
jgi:hypothetical protein